MLAKGTVRAAGLAAVVLASVALAGCIDPMPGTPGPAQQLAYEITPFNTTTLWRVGLPIPLLDGAPHPLVGDLALVGGRAEFEVIEMNGALTLSVVGAGHVRIVAASDTQVNAPANLFDLHWTHERNETGPRQDQFERSLSRDHYAQAIQPLVLAVSETMWWGGGCGGVSDGVGGDLSSGGHWTPLYGQVAHYPCVVE